MKFNSTFALVTIAVLGMISILVPVYILENLRQYDSPLFPMIRTGIEGISGYSFLFLLLSGFIVKLFSDVDPWKIGLMSMVLFPIATISEMIYDSSSHSMFPFEFIFYALYTLPAMVGALISQGIKKNLVKK